MLLKRVKIAVTVLFILTFIGFTAYLVYGYFTKDTQPPVFVLDNNSVLDVSVRSGDSDLYNGISAYDNVDGDLTDKIIVHQKTHLISNNTATVTYLVYDSSSNAAVCQREIRYVDYEKPHFSLSGPLSCTVGSPLDCTVISASDVIDGDLTGNIMYDSSVSSATAGFYPLIVRVTNSYGDSAYLTLTANIVSGTVMRPIINLDNYLIYLDKDENAPDKTDYAGMISFAFDPAAGKDIAVSDIQIVSDVNRAVAGTYNVYYSYTGKSSETTTVILTVVVE